MQIETGFVSLNGGHRYYEIAGSGPAVLFIHGFSLDTRMWDDQFDVFARQYRVIRFDVRGFGRSSPPSQDLYSNVNDIKALLEFIGEERAHLIGLSMGGGIAIDFALTYPEMTMSLLPVDAALGGFAWTTSFSLRAKDVGLAEAKRRWLAHPLFEPAMKLSGVAARLRQMINEYSGWHWLNHDPGTAPDPPAIHRLGEISAPTLVVVGEYDLPDFHGVADVLVRDIRTAQKVVLPGAGHMSNMETPGRFNEVVLGFLARE